MIIYPYRDAIESLRMILDERKQGTEEEMLELANLCDEFIGYADVDLDTPEDEEWDGDENE